MTAVILGTLSTMLSQLPTPFMRAVSDKLSQKAVGSNTAMDAKQQGSRPGH